MTDPAVTASFSPEDETAVLELLTHGELEPEGLLPEASNTTVRAIISGNGVTARCIYKPVRGERPLWDFPDGTLAGRELAGYLVSTVGGWDVVPPTVLRDGPLGTGACQLWIDDAHRPDAEQLVGFVPADELPPDWLPVADARGPHNRPYVLAHADDPRLAALAVFDAVVNNSDRKGGHVLADAAGQVYGVDHGVCFHTDDKLRTVLWGWADQPLPEKAMEHLERVAAALEPGGVLATGLSEHLTRGEIRATARRVEWLSRTRRYPLPSQDWPALPWPPI